MGSIIRQFWNFLSGYLPPFWYSDPQIIASWASPVGLCSQFRFLLGYIWVPLPARDAWKLLLGWKPGGSLGSLCWTLLKGHSLALPVVQCLKTVVSRILSIFLIIIGRWGYPDTGSFTVGSRSYILFLERLMLFKAIIFNQLTTHVWGYLFFTFEHVKRKLSIRRDTKTGVSSSWILWQ